MKQYLYDGADLIALYDRAGNLIQRYVHGAGVDAPLVGYDYTQGNLQARHWYYADQQGSVIATADDAGTTEQIYTYSPFGEPGQVGTSIFRYTGQVWDEETRLAYYKARYYSPKRGRFLSADPAGYVDSLNLYGYVVNDPVNLVDPSGLYLTASLNEVGNAVNLLGSVATDYVPGNQAFLNAIHSDSADAAAIFGIQAGLEVAAGFVGSTTKVVAFGFKNAGVFNQFSKTLNAGLADAGLGGTKALLQGSAVTGKSFSTGKVFDVGRVSDFDIALAGSGILARAKQLGIGLRSQGTRTGPLSAAQVQQLGLGGLQSTLSKSAGRPVNFMIFGDSATAASKAPSIGL